MESKNLYVPNHEKWLHYYKTITNHKHAPLLAGINDKSQSSQAGITTLSSQYIAPIEEKKVENIKPKQETHAVSFVSPSQQIVEQAESELERTGEMKTSKNVRRKKRKSSVKRDLKGVGRRQTNVKRKNQKGNKKLKKRGLKDIFV